MAAWRSCPAISPQIHEFASCEGYKVSFVKNPEGADIDPNNLVLGAENVHLRTRNDDKSSWYGTFRPSRRHLSHLARPGAAAPRVGAMDRPRSSRCWALPQR